MPINRTAAENATTFTLVHNMGWDPNEAARAVRSYVEHTSDEVDPEVEYVFEAVMDGRVESITGHAEEDFLGV